jgi:hypothetical protein
MAPDFGHSRPCGSPSFPISTFRADGPQFLQLPHDRRLDQRAIACAGAESSELGQPLLLLGSRHAAFNGRPFRLQRRQLRLETVYSGKVTCCPVCAIDLSLEGKFPLDQLLRICIAFRPQKIGNIARIPRRFCRSGRGCWGRLEQPYEFLSSIHGAIKRNDPVLGSVQLLEQLLHRLVVGSRWRGAPAMDKNNPSPLDGRYMCECAS